MMWTAIILFIAGVILVVTEFIVPGAILGVMGGVCLLVSTGVGWYHFPEYGLFIAFGELIGLACSILFGMYLMSRTNVAGFMTQKGEQTAEEGYMSPAEDPNLVGREGDVYSDLRPAGWIMMNGRRVDAVSNGSYIEKGARVRVIEVEGARVVVEKAEP